MNGIIDFLQQLAGHNNREWFNANKAWYVDCKRQFESFTTKLIDGIREMDPSIGALSVADCTYRIYRDTRFSADKTPYKLHFGAFVCPGGKKSDFAGYYFQVGATDKGFPSGCMLATGNYCYDAKVVNVIREDIVADAGRTFEASIAEAKKFVLDYDGALKRVPKGYEVGESYSDYLRLKNYCLVYEPGLDYMRGDDLLERVLRDFATTRQFLGLINRAIEYVIDESH